MPTHLKHWVVDYFHAAKWQGHSFLFRSPPKHYLGHVKENKNPIILIPGILEKWNFLKAIADPLSLEGHPVYVLAKLGYNTRGIQEAAKEVRELIEEKGLNGVVVIAHSKGGLIGKYALAHYNQDGKIKKVIAIATPFEGTKIVKFIPTKAMRELHTESPAIKQLHQEKEGNKNVVSIFGTFDNHVWPAESSRLEGAKNIQVKVHGHHKILLDKEVYRIINSEIT